MSKWTLESIKANIQAGDRFSIGEFNNQIIVKIEQKGFMYFHEANNELRAFRGSQQWENFKFYRNGEEILPPKERELIKFTEKLVDSNVIFLSDDSKRVYANRGTYLLGAFVTCLIEEIPNARVLYRYADDLTISHWGEK